MLILAIISVFLGAAGQICVKFGARALELDFSGGHLWSSLWLMVSNIPIMTGLLLYGTSFILWVKVLSKLDLSYAYPLVSLGYVMIVLFSYFFFHESITAFRLLGICLIIAGVLVVAQS
jgi:multidrug transporter EmrE-like cation transporter